MLLSEAVKKFIQSQHCPATAKLYNKLLSRFFDCQNIEVENIKVDYLTNCEQKFLAASTAHQTYQAMMAARSLFKYLRIKLGLNVLNNDCITAYKPSQHHWKNLTVEQLQKLFNHFSQDDLVSLRNLCICKVFYCTGVRDSELRQLTKSKIDWDRGEAEIIGKGGTKRMIFFTDECLNLLKKYLKMRNDVLDYLFIDHRSHKDNPISGSLVRTYMTRWSKELGFKVHAHMIRKSFCTELYRRSNDIYKVQKLAGHTSVTTTQNYAIVEDQELKDFHTRNMGKTNEFCLTEKRDGVIIYEVKGFCSETAKIAKLKRAIKQAADEILS